MPAKAHAHAVELFEALDAVADGQVFEGGHEADVALLLGGLDVGSVADPGDAVLRGHVGDHVSDLGGDVVVFHEGHVGGALEAAENVGGGDGGPAAGAGGVVAPLVAANAHEVDQLLHDLGQDEWVLVDIDRDSVFRDGAVADFLTSIEGYDRGLYAAHLAGQGNISSHIKLRRVGLLVRGGVAVSRS